MPHLLLSHAFSFIRDLFELNFMDSKPASGYYDFAISVEGDSRYMANQVEVSVTLIPCLTWRPAIYRVNLSMWMCCIVWCSALRDPFISNVQPNYPNNPLRMPVCVRLELQIMSPEFSLSPFLGPLRWARDSWMKLCNSVGHCVLILLFWTCLGCRAKPSL